MNNFFATPEGAWGDGSVHLTITGIVIVVVIIALLLIVAAFVRQKNASRKAALTTKQLVYSAVAIALAVVCSMIKLFEMPMGGSVTLLSMLFIVLIAYWYGPYVGIMTAVAYGLVQFVTEPIFYTIPQMLLDYPLAFGALGLAGFFNKKKWGLQIGYVVGVFGRFIFSKPEHNESAGSGQAVRSGGGGSAEGCGEQGGVMRRIGERELMARRCGRDKSLPYK